MRIFVLLNKINAGSYAGNLYELLREWLLTKNILIRETADNNEITMQLKDSHNTAIVFRTNKRQLSFFSAIKMRWTVKKTKPDYIIQFGNENFLKLSLPQLIVTNSEIEETHYKPVLSTLIAVSSQVEKQHAESENNIPATFIKVIPASEDFIFQPINWSEQQSVKMEYTQGREYYLTIAKGKTQESFTGLLKAFSTFKKWQQSNMKLMILGKPDFKEDEDWQEKISTYKFRDDVVWLTSLSLQQTATVTAGAYGFIHTPVTGNDIVPLLQSMQCESPCISFAISSVEEYSDGAAIVIEQNNYEQLAEKMILLYKDEDLRSILIAKGKERAFYYTKERTFMTLTDVFSTLPH